MQVVKIKQVLIFLDYSSDETNTHLEFAVNDRQTYTTKL